MFCGKCGQKIDDDSLFCIGCGSPSVPVASNNPQIKFCGNCGGSVASGARFCAQCGSPLGVKNVAAVNVSLFQTLVSKIRAEIIAWCVVIFIQILISCVLFSQGGDNTFYGIITAICAVLNIGSVYSDYDFLNQIRIRPAGIVARYESMPDFWIMFIWNLTRGMGIGLIAWIFTLLTRSFVLDNKQGFIELENQNLN